MVWVHCRSTADTRFNINKSRSNLLQNLHFAFNLFHQFFSNRGAYLLMDTSIYQQKKLQLFIQIIYQFIPRYFTNRTFLSKIYHFFFLFEIYLFVIRAIDENKFNSLHDNYERWLLCAVMINNYWNLNNFALNEIKKISWK